MTQLYQGLVDAGRIRAATEILKTYKQAKAALEERILSNERWYRLRHWQELRQGHATGDPEPASAWLLNCILNKHADAMDSYPQPVVLPREAGDTEAAALIGKVLPAVRELCHYEQVWSDVWWYKLKMGTGVTGVFWNPEKSDGAGDIDIRKVDLLNLFWEPGITDIQASRNVFHLEAVDRDLLEEQYPALRGHLAGQAFDLARYAWQDGQAGNRDKAVVVDWYYKKRQGGRTVLHYCKFVCGTDIPLFATENDPAYAQRGLYAHGKYPFVFDTLFPVEGSPCGFGYVDICRSPQSYIDQLDSVLLKYAVMASRPRFFIRGDGMVNEQEFADWTRDFVHFVGSGDPRDSVLPVTVPTLNGIYADIRERKVEEMKETAGNRDFQQGGTSGGVSAASAIEALQEAGSKLSRDMIRSAYRADAGVNELCIELMREFYTTPRYFRVAGGGFATFTPDLLAERHSMAFGVDMGSHKPVFDIVVKSEKASPFSTDAQNERAKELFRLGFFRPDMADQALKALDMMRFDGIEEVRARIKAMDN